MGNGLQTHLENIETKLGGEASSEHKDLGQHLDYIASLIGGGGGSVQLKTINGQDLHGEGNIAITTYQAFPSSWPTAGTTKAFCTAIDDDTTAVIGMGYFGGATFSDKPQGLANFDIVVEILEGPNHTKAIHLIGTSSSVYPYRWEYTFWSHNNVSGWRGVQPEIKVNPELSGGEATITALQFGDTKYAVGGGSSEPGTKPYEIFRNTPFFQPVFLLRKNGNDWEVGTAENWAAEDFLGYCNHFETNTTTCQIWINFTENNDPENWTLYLATVQITFEYSGGDKIIAVNFNFYDVVGIGLEMQVTLEMDAETGDWNPQITSIHIAEPGGGSSGDSDELTEEKLEALSDGFGTAIFPVNITLEDGRYTTEDIIGNKYLTYDPLNGAYYSCTIPGATGQPDSFEATIEDEAGNTYENYVTFEKFNGDGVPYFCINILIPLSGVSPRLLNIALDIVWPM